ncbi:hypothetical protein IT084_15390 [Desulfallas sp. Bu1-1]|uniref:hypothetical protein n=1 Tax=Desulfallas sp. Bu1-1 TaxID=2787620 RepID=UPI0018A03A71|nr:hypothetical protein [Desulfallas sp. Bu1-1]MBF7084337.1 hypothetical protein [Desulfallas sp. Bu1-1]
MSRHQLLKFFTKELILLQKDELDSLVRPGIVDKAATEIIGLMAQKGMILHEAREVLKTVEYRLGLIQLSMPEKPVVK